MWDARDRNRHLFGKVWVASNMQQQRVFEKFLKQLCYSYFVYKKLCSKIERLWRWCRRFALIPMKHFRLLLFIPRNDGNISKDMVFLFPLIIRKYISMGNPCDFPFSVTFWQLDVKRNSLKKGGREREVWRLYRNYINRLIGVCLLAPSHWRDADGALLDII